MFMVSDSKGNACIVEKKDVAELIVKDESTPFNKITDVSKDDDKFDKRHIIKELEDFICYFY